MLNFLLSIPLSLAIIFTPGLFQSMTNAGFLYCPDGCSVVVGGNHLPIQLVNNAYADNPTFEELMSFLKEDKTDSFEYKLNGPQAFICSDFAKKLHDNAEANGIRSGFASIVFENGHLNYAINVFETTDIGLVFIDSTGKLLKKWNGVDYTNEENAALDSYYSSSDTIAYLVTGEEYGRININYASSTCYAFYTEHNAKRAAFYTLIDEYNSQVSLFNAAVAGKAFNENSSRLEAIKEWQKEIEALAERIAFLQPEIDNCNYISPGVVSGYVLYW